MIPHSLSFYSSKGGVGKTSLTVNAAVHAALGGWRVLVVDLDPQGNVADGLGADTDPRYDGGASLRDALFDPDRLLVLDEVRPGLDLVPGGPLSEPVADTIHSLMANRPGDAFYVFDEMLAPIAGGYDLILFDLPPTPSALHNAALTSLGYIVVPTATDKFSRGSLGSGFERYRQILRASNPELTILAAVVAKHDLRLKRQWELAVREIHDVLGEHVPLLLPPIRYSQAADGDMKELGLVASEYVVASRRAKTARISWLKLREQAKRAGDAAAAGEAPQSFSTTALPLAEDYDAVLTQVLGLLQQALAAREGIVLETGEVLRHYDDKLPARAGVQ